MEAALETAAAEKQNAPSLGLQPEILKHTPMTDVEKKRMLDNLSPEAAAFFSSTVSEGQHLSRQSDI